MRAIRYILALSLAVPAAALAYGPTGHRIAGAAAQPLLCEAAAERVAELGNGQSLGELGLWADQIRSDDRWDHAAAWHYVNVDDDLSALVHPPEGDVLWAIEHFIAELEREDRVEIEHANALRFLTHFIVDLHQPLHVGLESDRGGNNVDVRYGSTTTNLHAFWDTDAVELTELDVAAYVAEIRDRVERDYAREATDGSTPYDWARESLSLRRAVYRFGGPAGQLSDTYLLDAQTLTKQRLIRAAARLAYTLNSLFCD